MADIKLDVLPLAQRELLLALSRDAFLTDYYLAGGTAVALLLGHRQSVDFDFFSSRPFDNREVIAFLNSQGDFTLFSESRNTVHGVVNGVRVSFLGYQYPVLEPHLEFGTTRISSLRDLAAMKLSAIASRGCKKDFIDFSFLLTLYPLPEILQDYHKKDTHGNLCDYQLLKSLVYFADAEAEPMPLMLVPADWDAIKTMLQQQVLACRRTLKL